MTDIGQTLANAQRSMASVGQSLTGAGQALTGAGLTMTGAGRSTANVGETSFNLEKWTLEAGAPYACFEVDSAAPRISGSEAAARSLTNDVNDTEDGRLGRRWLSSSFLAENQ